MQPVPSAGKREPEKRGSYDSLNCKAKIGKVLRLHTSQVDLQAGAYPGFSSMKRPGRSLLHHRLDASSSQGYTLFPALKSTVPIYTLGW